MHTSESKKRCWTVCYTNPQTIVCQAPSSVEFFQARILEWAAIFLLRDTAYRAKADITAGKGNISCPENWSSFLVVVF